MTTAASTTLAHSHVLATKGTPSMALPTVEVSRMPASFKSETGPVEEQGLLLKCPQMRANVPTLGDEWDIPVPVSGIESIDSREASANGHPLPPFILLTLQV